MTLFFRLELDSNYLSKGILRHTHFQLWDSTRFSTTSTTLSRSWSFGKATPPPRLSLIQCCQMIFPKMFVRMWFIRENNASVLPWSAVFVTLCSIYDKNLVRIIRTIAREIFLYTVSEVSEYRRYFAVYHRGTHQQVGTVIRIDGKPSVTLFQMNPLLCVFVVFYRSWFSNRERRGL